MPANNPLAYLNDPGFDLPGGAPNFPQGPPGTGPNVNVAGGATPGASAPPTGSTKTGTFAPGVSFEDFLRYLPGFSSQTPIDFNELRNFLSPSLISNGPIRAGRAGRAGGGGGQGGAAGAAGDLLRGFFQGGAPTIDPALKAQIDSLLGSSQGALEGFIPQIGGAQDPIMQLLLGELGGQGGPAAQLLSGGGFGGGGFGGGGASFATPNVDLRALPPEAQALIDQMTRSRIADLDLSRQDQTGQLVASLFGRGVPRSSIAQDEAGRLTYGQGALREQALASGSQQTLQAMLQDQIVRQQLAQTALQANAQTASAGIGAAGSASAAQSGALADLARARLGALEGIFGSRSSALANAFNSQLGANQGFASLFGDIGLGQLGAGTDRAGIAQDVLASQNALRGTLGSARIGANAQLGSERIRQQTALANLPFENLFNLLGAQEGQQNRFQQGILSLLGLGTDVNVANISAEAQRYAAQQAAKGQKVSTTDRILGLLGGFAGGFAGAGGFGKFFSDSRLKTEIRETDASFSDDEIAALLPREWEWNGRAIKHGLRKGAKARGVVAQELEEIAPDLISRLPDGTRMVDYGAFGAKALGAARRLLDEKEAN